MHMRSVEKACKVKRGSFWCLDLDYTATRIWMEYYDLPTQAQTELSRFVDYIADDIINIAENGTLTHEG